MDPFVVVILGGVAVIVIFVLLLGRFYPGSGADVLDWKPNHAAIETQIENELDDIDQMLCLLYTSPSPRDGLLSRMPSSA